MAFKLDNMKERFQNLLYEKESIEKQLELIKAVGLARRGRRINYGETNGTT